MIYLWEEGNEDHIRESSINIVEHFAMKNWVNSWALQDLFFTLKMPRISARKAIVYVLCIGSFFFLVINVHVQKNGPIRLGLPVGLLSADAGDA